MMKPSDYEKSRKYVEGIRAIYSDPPFLAAYRSVHGSAMPTRALIETAMLEDGGPCRMKAHDPAAFEALVTEIHEIAVKALSEGVS